MPERILRSRRFPNPKNAVYVGRPAKWGNPFKIEGEITRERAVSTFEDHVRKMSAKKRGEWLAPLGGKDLMCWCPRDIACHGDVLLKWANRT